MVALWSLVLITLAGVLHTVSAAGTATRAPSFAPLAARFGGSDTSAYGPWATTSGAAEALGIGGGAGPGVKAPGSAGLPVTAKAAPTAAPAKPTPKPSAPPPPSGVLPAPMQPWPPADPFMFVPGHPAFGVSNPTNYYAVAWGQCTWWAQWKRQDEYLAHMGNALYWLGGAAGRGYRTGGVPVAGATVVVQPGVRAREAPAMSRMSRRSIPAAGSCLRDELLLERRRLGTRGLSLHAHRSRHRLHLLAGILSVIHAA